jgi:hypothetical protein
MKEKRSQYLLLTLVLSIVLEGALRKWFLPEVLHPVAYFLKDIVAVSAILGVVPIPKHVGFGQYSRAALIAAFLVIPFIVGLFVLPSGAFLTFKNAVLWVAVAPIIAKHSSVLHPSKVSKVFFVLALLECGLGALQYASPIDSPLNRYAWAGGDGLEAIALFGGQQVVRATGTFSYITGYSSFAIVTAAWACYRLSQARGGTEFRVCVLTLVCGLGSALASGSRSAVYMILYCVVMLLLVVPHNSVRIRLGVGLSATLLLFGALGGDTVVNSFLRRSETAGDSFVDRISGAGVTFIEDLVENPIGGGLGTQSQLVSFQDSRRAGTTVMSVIEDGRARAVREAGVFAFGAMVLTILPLFVFCRRRISAGSLYRGGVFCIGVPLIWVVSGVLWFDHNGTALWWSLFGLWLGAEDVASCVSSPPRVWAFLSAAPPRGAVGRN